MLVIVSNLCFYQEADYPYIQKTVYTERQPELLYSTWNGAKQGQKEQIVRSGQQALIAGFSKLQVNRTANSY